MRNITSRIVNALNENIVENTEVAPVVEPELEVGTDAPTAVHKCPDCALFYTVVEDEDPSVCPTCLVAIGEPYAVVTPLTKEVDYDEELLDEEEVLADIERDLDECLGVLDYSDFKTFHENYKGRVKMNSKGELTLTESVGTKEVTVSRRMTTRQKASYALAEKYVPATPREVDPKKNESIKIKRQVLMAKNESRAIKVQAARLLERMGVKYDFKQFDSKMNEFINSRDYTKPYVRINENRVIESAELESSTPGEVEEVVATVVEDTGLEVVSANATVDGDAMIVNVRVEDSPEVEVHTSEITDVLSQVYEEPVEVVGKSEADGDSTLVDLAIVIGENEGDFDEEDEDPQISESVRRRRGRGSSRVVNESRRGRRSILREQFAEGQDDPALFALKSLDSTDEDPNFLANDDSLISGNEEGSEDKARLFISEESARAYAQEQGIEDKFEPVSIVVFTDEDLGNLHESTETYFEEDGFYYKEDEDGIIEEVDEEEYVANTRTIDDIKESFRRKRSRRKVNEGFSGSAKEDVDQLLEPDYWMNQVREFARVNRVGDDLRDVNPDDKGLQMTLDAHLHLGDIMDKYNLTLEGDPGAPDFDVSESEYDRVVREIESAQQKAFASYPNLLKLVK